MKKTAIGILFLAALMQLFGGTLYFSNSVGDLETLLMYEVKDKDLIVTLNKSDSKEIYTGLYKYDGSTLTDSDSTDVIKVEICAKSKKLRLIENGNELILDEIALELVQSREINRLRSEIKYPKFLGKSEFLKVVESRITDYFNTEEQEFWQEGYSYLTGEPEYFIGYSINLEAKLEMISSDLISISYIDYRFTGGAHGNYHYEGMNFSWKNDEINILRYDDFFREGSLESVSDLTISKLKMLQASDVVKGNISGFNQDDLSHLSFCNAGVNFYFPPYILDCYASGDFKVLVSWKELGNYIKADSPLHRFVKNF